MSIEANLKGVLVRAANDQNRQAVIDWFREGLQQNPAEVLEFMRELAEVDEKRFLQNMASPSFLRGVRGLAILGMVSSLMECTNEVGRLVKSDGSMLFPRRGEV